MSVMYHERPGVYAELDSSELAAATGTRKTVGLVAQAELEDGVYTLRSAAGARTLLGEESTAYRLAQLCLQNGAETVLLCPANDSYADAIARVLAEKQAAYLVTDSEAENVQLQLKAAVEAAALQNNECIGIISLAEGSVSELLARAAAINSERMVLPAPAALAATDETAPPAAAACCLAGQLAALNDPALPLHNLKLEGLTATTARYDDDTVDALVRGGVSPIEAEGGEVRLLRAVTTRTMTDGAADSTFRELSTILIADEVIPAIRRSLRAKFAHAKNNRTTRNAIRNQIVLALEERVEREIIAGYENIRVEASAQDPAVCEIEFGFSVIRGLSRIYLSARLCV